MRLFQTIILAILFTGCSNSQGTKPELTGEVKQDLKILLPDSEKKVDIIDGVKMDPRYELLYSKFVAAVKENNRFAFFKIYQIINKL